MPARVINKMDGSARDVEGGNRLKAERPSIFALKLAPDEVASFERHGNDLILVLKSGQKIIIQDFFAKFSNEPPASADGDASERGAPSDTSSDEDAPDDGLDRHDLVLEDGDGVTWWGQYPDQWSEFHFTEIETDIAWGGVNSASGPGTTSAPGGLNGTSGVGGSFTPIVLGALGLAGIGAIVGAAGGGKGSDGDDDQGNDGPDLTAANDSVTTSEDTPVNGSVAGNDSTTSGGTLSFAKASDPAHGTVVVNNNGTYTYTPDDNFTGQDSFTYTVTDPASGEILTRTVTITIDPVADLTAADDTNTTNEDTPVSGSVAGNDGTTSGGTLNFVKGSDPDNGTVEVNADGTYTYTPNPNFNGEDSFTYTVTDPASGESLTRTVTITVKPETDQPELTAADDSNTTSEDTPVSGSVAGNDSTTSGGALSFEKASDPANGTVIINSNGTYTYTPNDNFTGADSFTYVVTDSVTGESLTRTVTITVNPTTDLVAADDSNITSEDTPVSGSVAGNDSTNSGGVLSFVKASDPANGAVTVNSDGTYTYTPNENFTGKDSFTYTVTDQETGESLTRKVTITVEPVGDLAAANDFNTTSEDTPVSGSVAGNDSTTSGGALSFVTAGRPANGTVTVNNDGTYTYTPNDNFSGEDSFTYTVTDQATGESLTRTVTIIVGPEADLTAVNDTNTTTEDTPVSGSVAGNDNTSSGGALSFAKASNPANGAVTFNNDGTYTYTPNANFNGEDRFTYTVTDPDSGESLTQTVVITVNPVNDEPVANGTIADRTSADADGVSAVNVSSYFSDIDGDTLTYSADGLPLGLTIDPNTGVISGTIDNSASQGGSGGIYDVTVTATDGSGTSVEQSFVWTVTNPAPTAENDASTTDEDMPVSGNVIVPVGSGDAADSDSDSDTLTVTTFTIAGNATIYSAGDTATITGIGTLTLAGDGSYTFTPDANWNGTVPTVTYTVSDGEGGTDTANLIITVDPVVDVTGADDTNTTSEDTPVNGSVAGNDGTTSGGTLNFVKASDPANGTVEVNADGTYTYTPSPNFNGEDSFTYTVTDPASGESLTRTVTITVEPVADLTAINDTNSTSEDTPVSGSVSGNDNTISGGALSFAKTSDPSNGTVTLSNDGTYTYTPDDDFTGEDSFTYTVTDQATGESLTRTVTITVDPINDMPIIVEGDQSDAVIEAGNLDDGSVVSGDPAAAGDFTATDVDPDNLVWSVVGTRNGADIHPADVTYGEFKINPSTGAWTYALDNSLAATHALNEGHTVTLTYVVEVNDGNGGSETRDVTITINGTNDAPAAQADTATVAEQGVLIGGNTATPGTPSTSGNVLLNDFDVDANETGTLTVSHVGFGGADGTLGASLAGTYGTLVLNADGTYEYTLDNTLAATQELAQDATVVEVFSYTTVDENGATSTSTLTVTVEGTNDRPDLTSTPSDAVGTVTETGTNVPGVATATGQLSASDIDNDDTLAWSIADADGAYGSIEIDPDTGEWTYTLDNARTATQALNAGDSRTETFTAQVIDESGAYREQIITVTVQGSNDEVTGSGDVTVSFNEDGSATGSLQAYVDDIDGTIEVTNFSVDADGDGIAETYAPGTPLGITDGDGNPLGTLTIEEDGDYSFVPTANYAGAVPMVTYTMTEAGGGSVSVTQTIEFSITKVADAPALRANKTVNTVEDAAIALDLVAPVINDTGTGTGNDDHTERLGVITLSISGAGASGVTLANGAETLSFTGGKVTIVLADGIHVDGLPAEDPSNGIYHMTVAEYEALQAVPVAESGRDFTITVSATSYEVNAGGTIISSVPGATSTQSINVDVQAVTDGASLTIDGAASATVSGAEDTPVNLTSHLAATLGNTDGNASTDTDGSESYWYSVSGLPVGSIVTFGGTSTTITSIAQVVSSTASTSASPPAFTVTAPRDFSGDINDITVTLHSKDTDADSTGATATLNSSVTLNLHIDPVGGDGTVTDVSTLEDTAVAFLAGVSTTDTGAGDEVIDSLSFTIPTDWTITDPVGMPGWTNTGTGNAYVIEFDSGLTQSQREAILDAFLILPPPHSSADKTIALSITTTDTNSGPGDTQTVNRDLTITVTPVAERTDTDSDASAGNDVSMTAGHVYSSTSEEDAWFDLSSEPSFNLADNWSDQDGDEKLFAVLTPALAASDAGDTEIGTQFRYSTDGGATFVTATYTGTPIWVPVGALDTLEVKLNANVAGTLTIGVAAGTIDTDPDTGATVQAVSGSATLSMVAFTPVADAITMALNGRAVGDEDTGIPLQVQTTSSDPSETFDLTISNIPVGAAIIYGGSVLTPVGGSVTISDFSNGIALSVTPPPDSNEDFSLTVSAVSVDGTDTSDAITRTINVSVTGVADAPSITLATTDFTTTEAVLDSTGNHRVALSNLVTGVNPTDADGSETITVRITGLAEGFSVTGAITVVSGTGTERVWVTSASNLNNVSIVTPANYSGTVDLQVSGVTTENDGDTLIGAPVNVSFAVTPSPEGSITNSATLVEDQISPLNLDIIPQDGDTNETLGEVYIAVDYDTSAYTLFVGATELASAGLTTTTIAGSSYYVIPAEQVGDLGARTAPNRDGALGVLEFQYQVVDSAADGSLPSVAEINSGSLTLTATPVSDAVDASITAITMTGATGTSTDTTVGDDATPDKVVVTEGGTFTVNLHVHSTDVDTSEHLIRIVIDNVPDGVTVTGAAQLGSGSWLLVYAGSDARSLGAGGIDVPVEFVVGAGVTNATSSITMTPQVQDHGDRADSPAEIESDTVGWSLEVAISDGSTPPPPPSINEWEYNGAPGTEDTPFALGEVIDAAVSTSDPGQSYVYTITIRNLPESSVVEGMTRTTIGGETIYTATVTVAAGADNQAALNNLLAGIQITPPENDNDNNADFSFDARLATSAVGGLTLDANTAADMAIAPVSDPAKVVVTANDVDEGGNSVTATIEVTSLTDGSHGQIVDGKLYVQVSENNNSGGTVSDSGGVISRTSVSGVDGVPEGDYYVIDVDNGGGSVELRYTAAAGSVLQPGEVTFAAWGRAQESGAGNIVSSAGSDTAQVIIVNNGVIAQSEAVTGDEASAAVNLQAIELTGLSIELVDNDGSEAIQSVLLSGLPVGFQLMVGNNAGDATLAAQAANAGGETWILSSDGTLPPYIAILPATNWSGTLSDLELVIESIEDSLGTTSVDTVALEPVTVLAVASGVELDPTLAFGSEGTVIDINLNASMADAAIAAAANDDSTETTTLEFTGLGAHAVFYIGGSALSSVSYDADSETYTLTGLRQDDLDKLGFVQAASSLTDQDASTSGVQVSVSARTVEGSNGDQSASSSGMLTLLIDPGLATIGDDSFIFGDDVIDGGAGKDTVKLRAGEDVTNIELVALLENIENIDLSAPGPNEILGGLSVADVQNIIGSTKGTLTINGESGDAVELSSTSDWTTTGSATGGYIIYSNASSGTTVAIDELVAVSYILG